MCRLDLTLCGDWPETRLVYCFTAMNNTTFPALLSRLFFRLRLSTRYLSGRNTCNSFGTNQMRGVIERIYVINLDRQNDRWGQVRRELGMLRDQSERPLVSMTRRFSAVDARYYEGPPSVDELLPHYTLADQLFVEPNPFLKSDGNAKNQYVNMTPQEVAVALSHIEVWKTIAESDPQYTLVLEDDAYFCRGFARTLEKVWAELNQNQGRSTSFDILYLSYKEATTGATRSSNSDLVFRPLRGLWQLSGYVLSRQGARRLLELLPVRGPVDLWINHQFDQIDVLATKESLIDQRPDCPSTNSYSILPILSKVGVLKHEKPQLFKQKGLPKPVLAFGRKGSGLTSLAMALSMLGYRCCSDVAELPSNEIEKLLDRKRGRVFDAYVNVGSLKPEKLVELAKTYPQARFIITEVNKGKGSQVGEDTDRHLSAEPPSNSDDHRDTVWVDQLQQIAGNVLIVPVHHRDKWDLLCTFLGCEYPSGKYPEWDDKPQRIPRTRHFYTYNDSFSQPTRLRSDTSPWVVDQKNWSGIPIADGDYSPTHETAGGSLAYLDNKLWKLRDDTFPSNLALFTRSNFSVGPLNDISLTLRKEHTSVRDYTSAAVCTRRSYLYGRFVAELRPSNVSGIITGMFLHRNSPRQEIDIELMGNDTTKMLLNVYYNPGGEGTRMEYGYRGTPALIELGFDASEDFHRYEIEWTPNSIRWYVDGYPACERMNWDPTPIPHLRMELNVNLWHSRSIELAGRLSQGDLPARTDVRSIEVHT